MTVIDNALNTTEFSDVPVLSETPERSGVLSSTEEARLVDAARNGDSLALSLLVVKYRSFLSKYVSLLNIPSCYKEDFVQEGLIGLLKAVRTYNEKVSAFSTYACRCMRNSVISELRKYKRRGIAFEVGLDDSIESVASASAVSPEDEYVDRESLKQLHDTVFSVLSPFESSVFEMYLADTPYAVMSKRLGKDVKSVDNAIQRIKNKLKKLV